jgi:hypothetical protein
MLTEFAPIIDYAEDTIQVGLVEDKDIPVTMGDGPVVWVQTARDYNAGEEDQVTVWLTVPQVYELTSQLLRLIMEAQQ